MAKKKRAPRAKTSRSKSRSPAPGPSRTTTARSSPRTDAASPPGGRARIRVYRHGLGDCILVRVRRQDGTDYKILIDCGVAVATSNAVAMMTQVVEDVTRETNGQIDVLAVTHEHWDHVSGFTQAAQAFKKLAVGEVWVAWTEDQNDPLAKSLRKDHAAALTVLQKSAAQLRLAGNADSADTIESVLGMAGAAGDKTRTAFDSAKQMGKPPNGLRYWQPDSTQRAPNQQTQPLAVGDPDVTIYALGPPYDAKLIRKTLPSTSNPETYKLKIDGGGGFPPDVASKLLGEEDELPFPTTVSIPLAEAQKIAFFQDNYWTPGKAAEWRRIDGAWLGAADELALAMQSATNNTSLVLAIELAGGDVLLFAGDAQVGNWLSWQDRKWKVGTREVTGPDLLKRTIFYKVGHHGSHNATLRREGLEMMEALKTAVIPVDQVVAKKMRWGAMPLDGLVDALRAKVGDRVLRTDVTPPRAVPGIAVDKLYFEITI